MRHGSEPDVFGQTAGIHQFGQDRWSDRREQRLVAVPTYGRVS